MVVKVIHKWSNWSWRYIDFNYRVGEEGWGRKWIGWPAQAAREGRGGHGLHLQPPFWIPLGHGYPRGIGYYLSGPQLRQWSIRVLLPSSLLPSPTFPWGGMWLRRVTCHPIDFHVPTGGPPFPIKLPTFIDLHNRRFIREAIGTTLNGQWPSTASTTREKHPRKPMNSNWKQLIVTRAVFNKLAFQVLFSQWN